MSEKSDGNHGFNVHGYTYKKFSYLEGRVRTIVEALGLPEKQESSLTDLIVGELWGAWDNPEYSYGYKGVPNSPDAVMLN